MKKINSLVLSIAMSVLSVLSALSAMFLFAACSTNQTPLDESNLEDTPTGDLTRSDSTKNDPSENDTIGGSVGAEITGWETVRDSIVVKKEEKV